jgi:hypothetical protein
MAPGVKHKAAVIADYLLIELPISAILSILSLVKGYDIMKRSEHTASLLASMRS